MTTLQRTKSGQARPWRARTAPLLLASSIAWAGAGCSEAAPVATSAIASSGQATSTAAPVRRPPAPIAASATVEGEPCGELGCLWFDTPELALAHVLADKPLVLGVGESHAQKGTEGVRSVTVRFRESLLPQLAPLASDIVIELWDVDPKCRKTQAGAKDVGNVAEKQTDVTKSQTAANPAEFLALGRRSKELGVEPHKLVPSCDEYARIARARGDDAIALMLQMLTQLTAKQARAFYDHNRDAGLGKMVVTYGGAMHNDLEPPAERADWSFGPELSKAAAGNYTELDLIVPEYIRDTAAWKAMSWYGHFDRDRSRDKVTLFTPTPRSHVLVFAATTPSAPVDSATPSTAPSASSAAGSASSAPTAN